MSRGDVSDCDGARVREALASAASAGGAPA